MKIKMNDQVMIMRGKEKGMTGNVIAAKDGKVKIEGKNMVTKHVKKTTTAAGELKTMENWIDASNVMVYDDKEKKVSRIGYDITGERKVRVFKKTGKKLASPVKA